MYIVIGLLIIVYLLLYIYVVRELFFCLDIDMWVLGILGGLL